MNTGLDQYMDIFKDAVEDSAAKLTKSFEKILIEVIILFMVIPRKINFTQMGVFMSPRLAPCRGKSFVWRPEYDTILR